MRKEFLERSAPAPLLSKPIQVQEVLGHPNYSSWDACSSLIYSQGDTRDHLTWGTQTS